MFNVALLGNARASIGKRKINMFFFTIWPTRMQAPTYAIKQNHTAILKLRSQRLDLDPHYPGCVRAVAQGRA